MRSLPLLPLLVLSVTATAHAQDDYSGKWRSSFGTLELKQEGAVVTGRYPKGTVKGTVKGKQLTGTWTEGASGGEMVFDLTSNGSHFRGKWRKKGSRSWGSWNGRRIGAKRQPAEKPPAKPAKPAGPKTSKVTVIPSPANYATLAQPTGLYRLRAELASAALKQLEAHAEKGEMAKARLLLWGLWAQAKAARNALSGTKQERAAQLKAIDTAYQRARDACYGSMPQLSGDDDAVAVASQLVAAHKALKVGDVGGAMRVIEHIKARYASGVQLPEKVLKDVSALIKEYNAKNLEANAVFQKGQVNALVKAGSQTLAGKRIEEALQHVYKSQEGLEKLTARQMSRERWILPWLNKTSAFCRGLINAIPSCRKALLAFAKVAPDPEWMDSAFVGFIKKDRSWQKHWDSLQGAILCASYSPDVLRRLKLPGRLGLRYLERGYSYLKGAERCYQKGSKKAGDANLAKAESNGLAIARQLQAPAEALARFVAQLKEIRASAGVGKLKRAKKTVADAEKALAWAAKSPSAVTRVKEKLEAARGWLTQAKTEGVPAAEAAALEARMNKVQAGIPGVYVLAAERELKFAGEYLVKAKAALGKPEEAYRASYRSDTADKHRKKVLEHAAKLGEYDKLGGEKLKARAADLSKRIAAMRGQAADTQTMPADAYTGSSGASWRSRFKRMLRSEREWKVLALHIIGKDWKDKTVTYSSTGGTNLEYRQTRWYRRLFVWAAIENPKNPDIVDLRYLGFQLHKMTDGSYRKLKLYWVNEPHPMSRKNLPK